MNRREEHRSFNRGLSFCGVMAKVLAFLLVAGAIAPAQTISVLHSFTDRSDGSGPFGGVALDRAGNLYGTTSAGGDGGEGTVYKMSHVGSGWILNTLYAFNHPHDPLLVMSGVVFGPDGTLYGTGYGGGANDHGAVFNLQPPAAVCRSVSCPWTMNLIHSFSGSDGSYPEYGNLTFDSAGNIYGTTSAGGAFGYGVVFKLTRSGSSWKETVLYSFTGGYDSGCSEGGVTFDNAGNLWGTNNGCDLDFGAIYELYPSGSGWLEATSFHFISPGGLGADPIGGVAVDAQGNLYGTTSIGGSGGAGTAWVLSPSGGSWIVTQLQAFTGYEGPFATPIIDADGNVYGTSAFAGADGDGAVYKVTPSGGGWNYTEIDFNGSNGSILVGGVSVDAHGNLYGTAASGGSDDFGVVWEITP